MTTKPNGTKRSLFIAIGCVIVLLVAGQHLPGSAQPLPPRWWWDDLRILCGPSKEIYEGLVKKYEETPVILADVVDDGDSTYKSVSVWVNTKKETLTILLSTKDGKGACMISTGEHVKLKMIKTGLEI